MSEDNFSGRLERKAQASESVNLVAINDTLNETARRLEG
jgi:hypothetical protein